MAAVEPTASIIKQSLSSQCVNSTICLKDKPTEQPWQVPFTSASAALGVKLLLFMLNLAARCF